MLEDDPGAIGNALQNYIRRKWRLPEYWTVEGAKNIALANELKERVDLLGIDDKLLLETEPGLVLDRLRGLEMEAVSEDLGVDGTGIVPPKR
ncbi:hypothetical protein [Nitratireductor sp. GCM10026969]|uniref:hypothetical protein n=1 Tax=Nitratireductor sp. GCM10026969 TaxID=3252645 RepID=UPI00361D91FA